MMNENKLQAKTISDFGVQWSQYNAKGSDYFFKDELFDDIAPPLLRKEDVKDKFVAEIGSGSGRITSMLMHAGVKKLLAIEPSIAFKVLKRNTREFADKIIYINDIGAAIPSQVNLDYIFSIGVIHHIPEPDPTIAAAYQALAPGGKLLIWVYGKEGNGLYLFFLTLLRRLTTRLPHTLLKLLTDLIYPYMWGYMQLCKTVALPLHQYFNNVLSKFDPEEIRLSLYDQLNPAWAKYYRREEVIDLLSRNGFIDIKLHHRHGYSWTALGMKPLKK